MNSSAPRRRAVLATFGALLGATTMPGANAISSGSTNRIPATTEDGDWQQRGGDATHAGYQSGSAFPVQGATVAMQTADGVKGQAAVVDGTIYTVDQVGRNTYATQTRYDEGRIRARDVGTTDPTWQRTFEEDFSTPAVVSDDIVYAGYWNGAVRAFDVDSGETKWTFNSDFLPEALTVAEGSLFVAAENQDFDERLFAIDAATGEERWRTDGKSVRSKAPTVHDGLLYTGGYNLFALDTSTGDVVWESDVDSGRHPVLVEDGTLFVGGNTIKALDPADGTVHWEVELDYDHHDYRTAPATDGDAVYIGFPDQSVASYDLANGDRQWRADTVGLPTGPVVVTDGAVYVSCSQEFCYAFDPDSGAELWRASLRERSSLSLAGDSLFAASAAGLTRFVAGEQTTIAADHFPPIVSDWVARTGHEVDGGLTVGPDNVYFNLEGRAVKAYTRDGDDEWDTTPEYIGKPLMTPALGDERVFVITSHGYLAGLDRTSGEVEWNYEPDSGPSTSPRHLGDVVLALSSETAYGVDPDSGEERFRVSLSREPEVAATSSDAVYLLDRAGEIQIVSADGSSSTATPTPDGRINALQYADESLYASTESGVIAYALDQSNPRWEYSADDRVDEVIHANDGVLYVGDEAGTVAALDLESGEERWAVPVDGVPEDVVAAGGGVLAVGISGETVAFLDAESGTVIGRYDATGPLEGVEIADERAYVLDSYGTLHAVVLPDPTAGTATTVAPGSDSDSQRTGSTELQTGTGSTRKSDDSIPGFTGLAGVVSLLGAGAWLRHRAED